MKFNKRWLSVVFVVVAAALVVSLVAAESIPIEDGVLFRRNISKTPDSETERAGINHMSFYVPAQSSNGTVLVDGIDYLDPEGVVLENRLYAKPLVSVYIDAYHEKEPIDSEDENGFSILTPSAITSGAGLGQHDAYAALSLDDGATWKRTNLSNSADLSSFDLANGTPYPGDAHNMTFAVAGDKVLVGWISKYCDGGTPLYTFDDEEVEALQLEFELPDLYVRDIWGVGGSQKSVDFTALGYPEVGEVPYSCVWSARGQLLEVDEEGVPTIGGGLYDIVWTKAERLTSGRRDANRLEMNGDSAAGFMMTWQEDPEGLRPGDGLGPGEGWSGAVVNQQTDLWYSFIAMDDFIMVKSDDTDEATAVDIALYTGDSIPKVFVPMAMPIRLTDNKKCMVAKGNDNTEEQQFLYCFVNFDDDDPYNATDLSGIDFTIEKPHLLRTLDSTFCATTIPWTNPGGVTLQLCQAEDGRVLGGRVGASRPRVNVQPYDNIVDGIYTYNSAIVIMGAEESKAMGEGSVQDMDGDEEIEPEDIGKNMWYYSFDLLNPSFVMQGGMLNQPAVCGPQDLDSGCTEGDFFPLLEDDFGNEFYETEISRRFSHMSQPIHQFGPEGISSVLIVKQGILNQGGPADIFLRMTKAPDDVWELCDLDGDGYEAERCLPEGYNPYAYENLVCENLDGSSGWKYTDETNGGVNPRYIQGLCTSNMVNVSGTTIDACDNGTSGADCAAAFPWDGGVTPFPKVTQWSQSGPNYGVEITATNIGNLGDQSWVNPYDVAKGHRGFIDGDFIMMMYAWSPNWKANSVGNDHYNLYARRSFDGGKTWTTTPAALGGEGTETCENFKQADKEILTVCTSYGVGEFEQARNLSQLIGNKETILDPRYTPTGGLKMLPITDLKGIGFSGYSDDVRDPTKFFIVYETGDNTTVAEGEAVPMDLFYSRATNYGDDYDLTEYYNSTTGESTFGFDWLEHDREDLSGEAGNTCNNGGTFYYVVWNQWQEDAEENVSNSDIIFRRTMFDDVDVNVDILPTASLLYVNNRFLSWELPGEEIHLAATASDKDILGDEEIVEYEWLYSTADGEYTDVKVGNGKVLRIDLPGWALKPGQPGWATFSFRAKDAEGNWTEALHVEIFMAPTVYKNYAPLITH